VLLVTSMQLTSAPFLSVQYQGITALKRGWMLGDIPLCLTFLLINALSHPIMLHRLCTFLLIVANLRWSALTAPIAESNRYMMYIPYAFLSLFSSFLIFFIILLFQLQFLYIDTQPTLAGLHLFLLGFLARCTFLLYLRFFFCIDLSLRVWPHADFTSSIDQNILQVPSASLPSPQSSSALLRYAWSDPIPIQPDMGLEGPAGLHWGSGPFWVLLS